MLTKLTTQTDLKVCMTKVQLDMSGTSCLRLSNISWLHIRVSRSSLILCSVSQGIYFKILLIVYKSLNDLSRKLRFVIYTFQTIQVFWFKSTPQPQNQNQTLRGSIQFLCSTNLEHTLKGRCYVLSKPIFQIYTKIK